MDTVVFKPSIVETWLDLLQEAQNDTAHELDQDVLSYLVLLLIRFTDDPALATSVLALEYLQSQHLEGRLQRHCLREVGDKCLLYSGLFPKRARRRRVRVSYYVDLGRSAYQSLAEGIGRDGGLTYGQLA
ncbi:MAG TPA: hypothetical protein ENJ19_10055, partial [Gammaproteobacteria bacterium]|nr:hypothetical protein [Gammaproteobacteria bacterium]